MSDRQVRVVVSAVDKGAGNKLTEVGSKGHAAGEKITAGFQKLGGLIGGEVGSAIQEASDKLEHFGKGHRLEATSAAVAGLGGVLAVMGSGEQQASQQLDLAIKNSGHSAEEFAGQIEETVGHMEHFGHSAVETKAAMQTLVSATRDPKKAIEDMGLVADLAAARHISLGEAADSVAKILNGAGARTLKMYGITMDSTKQAAASLTSAEKGHEAAVKSLQAAEQKLADLREVDRGKKKLTITQEIAMRNAVDNVKTAQEAAHTTTTTLSEAQDRWKKSTTAGDDALKQLGDRLHGQAAAAANTFSGRLKALRTEVEDNVAAFGQKYGPAIMVAGTALGAVKPIASGVASAVKGVGRMFGLVATAAEESAVRQEGAEARSAAAVQAGEAEKAAASEEGAAKSHGALGKVGLGMIGLTAVVGLGMKAWDDYHAQEEKTRQETQALTDALDADSGALGKNVRATVANTEEKNGSLAVAQKYGLSLSLITDAAMGNTSAQQKLVAQVKALSAAHKITNGDAIRLIGNMKGESIELKNAQAAHGRLAAAMNTTSTATQNLNAWLKTIDEPRLIRLDDTAVQNANAEVRTLISNLNNISNAAARGAQNKRIGMVGMNAGGSDFFAGGETSIAEREPEIVSLPRGSKITPVSRIHGGGGTNIQVNINVPHVWAGNSQDLGRVMVGALEQFAGAGGKIRIKNAVN